MAESWPGRIHARAIFEKVKIYFVNFLLIISVTLVWTGVTLLSYIGASRAGDRPLVQPQASYDL